MQAIHNQPVSFVNTLDVCTSDEFVYNQLVDNTDITQFQLSIAPCSDAVQALSNPTFSDTSGYDLGDNWTFGTNTLCTVSATDEALSTDVLPEGYWRIKVIVASSSTGYLNIVFENVIGGGTTTIGTIYLAGEYYFYGFAITGGAIIHLVPDIHEGCTLCLTELSALPLVTDVTVTIYDLDDVEVSSINNTDDSSYFTFVEDTVTVDINWADLSLSNNCYYFQLTDLCTEITLISNTFKLGDYLNGCNFLINVCNNNDSMGFRFTGTGFSPRLRIESKLKTASYTNEKNIFENSAGTKGAYYFSRRKIKILAVDLQPEYIHDFLSTLGGYDNFYIDNVPYFVEDSEYSVIYNQVMDNFGTVNIQVSEKTQDVKNILLTDNTNNCNLAV